MQVGETAHLSCSVQRSSPPSLLSWYINDEPVCGVNYHDDHHDHDHHGLSSGTSMMNLYVLCCYHLDHRHDHHHNHHHHGFSPGTSTLNRYVASIIMIITMITIIIMIINDEPVCVIIIKITILIIIVS